MKKSKNELVLWKHGRAFHAWRERGAPTVIASLDFDKAKAKAYAERMGMEFREES